MTRSQKSDVGSQKLLTLVAAAGLMAALSVMTMSAQQGAKPAGPVPRTADGKPDLSGVWWLGGDVGSRAFSAAAGRGRGQGPAPATYTDLLRPEVAAAAKTMNDNDDPTLRCMPTAFGTMNVSFMDVGAIGQIIQTPTFVVMLTETYHGFKLIPTDGRPHRAEVPPSYRGDSVGRWDGDVFVVETKNFTDDTWIWAEGRVSPHSDQMRVVERYRRLDANTLQIEATIEDPKALTKPWVVPTQTLTLAPFDQIMPLVCASLQDSIKDVAR